MRITGRKKGPRVKWVKSLFGYGTNGWNVPLVHSVFLPHDAEEILKIRVPEHNIEDIVAWNYKTMGCSV